MTTANAHALFKGLRVEPSFKRKIHIQHGDDEDSLLRQASERIRQCLRLAFGQVDKIFASEEGRRIRVAKRDHASIAKSAKVQVIDVRFLRQGSFAYQTLVRPAKTPPQEIDLDDGVYVPVEFVDDEPIFSSDALFYVVEKALASLLDEEPTWTLCRKPTCVRVQLGDAGAHIDLPLFAVEQSEFNRVQKNFEKAFGEGARKAEHLNNSKLAKWDKHYRVPSNAVRLAHRDEDWVHSDPKAFQDWFESWVDDLGTVCRRVTMYLKAWRDQASPDIKLSSLAVTITTVWALDELAGKPAGDRDDAMTLVALHKLRASLAGEGILHPITNARLDAEMEGTERAALIARVDSAIDGLNTALNHCTNAQVVVKHLRTIFGARFPNSPHAVKIDQASQLPQVTKESASRVPHPNIISSTSG
ncbi:CBASS cGAMP synthase [Maricaulis sp. CAU 1757]